MPPWSARLIRTAFLALATGFTLGAVLLIGKAGFLAPLPPWFRTVHAEVLLFGWFVQLVLGVAWWIFPRHIEGAPRGDRRIMPAAFVLLNGGVLLYVAGLVSSSGPATFAGRAAEALAVLAVAAQLLPRIRGSRLEGQPR